MSDLRKHLTPPVVALYASTAVAQFAYGLYFGRQLAGGDASRA